jgi:hypothetical protein
MRIDWSNLITPNGRSPSWNEIREFEVSVGFEFPIEFKLFLFQYNGGKVHVEHSFFIEIEGVEFEAGVDELFPLNALGKHSIGLIEWRRVQLEQRSARANLLIIGDDMGTGRYYMSLGEGAFGAIFFAYDDDVGCEEQGWEHRDAGIPSYMVRIADSFNDFALVIWQGRE